MARSCSNDPIEPMTLANMYELGSRSLFGLPSSSRLNADRWPDRVPVP